ncbi:MAG: glycoside hydrolase family 16 protein [Trebonia sp.]
MSDDEPAWPGEETAIGSPWPDAAPPPGTDAGGKRQDPPRSKAHKHGKTPMRGALMVSGTLGAVVVIAVGLVGLTLLHRSPNGTAAANVTKATTSATASTQPSASHKATASAKAKPKAKTKPKAKGTATKSASSPLTVPAGWNLTFAPSFSGASLDTSTWSTCYQQSAQGAGCTNNPSVEKEWYLASQVSVSGGTLNLTAKQETTQGTSSSGAPMTYDCRSGMVTSQPGFNFTYGLLQVTAKIPYGPGLWPALWLEPSNGDWPPELDMMEHWYSQQDYKVYDHFTNAKGYLGGPVPTPVDLSAGFHTFSLLWTKDRVTWYLDGAEEFTTTAHVPQQAMYFIANVADRNPDGDNGAGLEPGTCNGTMQISSVKVYQP